MAKPPSNADAIAIAVAQQFLPGLPGPWQRFDGYVVRATGWALFAIGVLFTVLIISEVISRYVFSFSISQADSAAQYLLIWFFLLGASVALRERAHVAFELLLQMLPAPFHLVAIILGQLMILGFFLIMLWSGVRVIPSSLEEMEGATGVSLFWVMAAFPVGFCLLIYTQLTAFVSAMRSQPDQQS